MSETPLALRPPFGLKLTTALFVVFWVVLAAFPLVWIAVMSFKLPVDAFAANPLQVIFGPDTRAEAGGFSAIDVALGIALLVYAYRFPTVYAGKLAPRLALGGSPALGWVLTIVLYIAAVVGLIFWGLGALSWALNGVVGPIPLVGLLAEPVIGATFQHYQAVWVDNAFYTNFVNSMVVTFGVVTISLTVGTLAGYALARTGSNLAFWLLIAALIFRALPHSVLVTGYLPPFLNSKEILEPLWTSPWTGWLFGLFGPEAPTFYGQPLAVIIVLVSINQPFTIWMLRSFFMNIPTELDEAARVDGCSVFGAFRRVIIPVMWPGVITTGLFSFLLAYNDYLVTALLLDAQSMTMVPAITQYFNRETTTTDQIEAVAAAVSITAPLFLLVMVFQRQIVSGLTQGAVKG
jgi:multiple sugar transport system permease protein